MSERLLLRGGRLIDPAARRDVRGDLLVEDGRVAAIGAALAVEDARILELNGQIVAPGFIDLHCHLREPGFEYKETIATGRAAAARGGFTTVCCMPNTDPVIDNRSVVEAVQRAARGTGPRVLPIGAVTKGQRGEELAEMGELAAAGVVAFSDDGQPVANSRLMRHALEYARLAGRPVMDHCQDPDLAEGGVMNEGWVATRLGLPGMPAAAEEAHIARDIQLAELTGGWVHIAHLSTAGGVALVRAAKRRGLAVTAEATPHHLTLTEEWVLGSSRFDVRSSKWGSSESVTPASVPASGRGLTSHSGRRTSNSAEPPHLLPPPALGPYDTSTKVNPPLRTWTDALAVAEGVADGTIDAIATDHAPHAAIDKECEYAAAAFGISGLETALGLVLHLVHTGRLDLMTALHRLSTGPAAILGDRLPAGAGSLTPGAPADLVVFDPTASWVVDPAQFASKGRNTPLAGATLRGRVTLTLVDGVVVWEGFAAGVGV